MVRVGWSQRYCIHVKVHSLQAVETNGTINFEMSGLRTNPDYIEWFTKSLIVHPFLTTTVMPISVLVVLNYLIYR